MRAKDDWSFSPPIGSSRSLVLSTYSHSHSRQLLLLRPRIFSLDARTPTCSVHASSLCVCDSPYPAAAIAPQEREKRKKGECWQWATSFEVHESIRQVVHALIICLFHRSINWHGTVTTSLQLTATTRLHHHPTISLQRRPSCKPTLSTVVDCVLYHHTQPVWPLFILRHTSTARGQCLLARPALHRTAAACHPPYLYHVYSFF